MKTLKELFKEHGIVPGDFVYDTIERVVESYSAELRNELLKEKKLNEEIKVRFVKCNTCTDEMKDKCLMFSENLCSGERCEELVDLMALVSKSDCETKLQDESCIFEPYERKIKNQQQELRKMNKEREHLLKVIHKKKLQGMRLVRRRKELWEMVEKMKCCEKL